MKATPLIILIPCILALGILFWVDRPQEAATPNKTESQAAGAETGGKDVLTLSLVVGQAGSLENDIGNPVYSAPDEIAEQEGTLQYNCCMLQAEEEAPEGWIGVELSDGSTGYVQSQSVLLKTLTVYDHDTLRMEIARDAVQYLGLRFKRYGDSLNSGIDCSHFAQQIYARNGRDIPETCNEMIAEGTAVPVSDARTGDIIYYDVNDGYGHVGIYLGDGYLINATGHAGRTYPDGGVRICALKYRDREVPQAYDLLDTQQDEQQ